MSTILHLSEQCSIAIVEIAVASLTFLFSTFAIVYRGWSRAKTGFIYLSLASLIHIIGSACYVSYELNGVGSSFEVAYAVCSFISVGPLLMAALSFSQFTDATSTNKGISSIIVSILHFLPAIGVIVGIAGGADFGQPSSTDETKGRQLLQASSIIFLVAVACIVSISAINVSFVRSLRTLAITVSTPFLMVRVVLDILQAWADVGSNFQFNLPGWPEQIFMRFICEYVVVLLYLFTGLGALAVTENAKGEESDASELEKKEVNHQEPIPQPPTAHHHAETPLE